MELREDQREIAKRLVEVLKSSQWVALQAPTGWGKTLVGLAVIKELGLKPALWLTPRLSIEIHVYNHAVDYFGLKTLATAGKEKMCAFNRSIIDFAKGVCRSCPLNKPVRLGDLNQLSGSLDFGRVKEYAESMGICPYSLQSVLERRNFDLLIAHYHRANKLVRTIRPRVVVVDEVHNTLLPAVHRIEVRTLTLILQKLGFEEGEINQLVQSPETLKIILSELLDALVSIEDDELQPYIEEVVAMLRAQIWYFEPGEGAINALELPEIPRINTQVLLMSATLPPQLLSGDNVIIVRRGWNIPIRIDARFALTMENIERRKDEISKYIAEKYLTSGTVVFTTVSRELLLSNEVTWEDELIEKGRTPCDVKTGVLALKTFGRYAEGIDLDCFSRLVVLGLPLLPPDVMLRLRSKGINERDFIIIKTIQIIGRAFRSSEPPPRMPEVYLVDKRFLQIKDELQKYEIQAQLET